MSSNRTPPTSLSSDDLLRDGLPTGVLDLAANYVRQYASEVPCDLVDLLTAPLRLDAEWPQPAQPLEVQDGWVQVELTEQDQQTFDGVAEQWRDLGPERFASACQELRLPVCPYRSPSDTDHQTGAKHRLGAGLGCPESRTGRSLTGASILAGTSIVDLSTHWAGPLATKLLAEAGASVVKIDPACRPDGFRARPQLYQHLNGDKEIIDLDLRRGDDRAQFEALLAGADLLVESFSRRVMSNLGYHPNQLATQFPRLATLSVKAFPLGTPEQSGLAFGPGVHAAAGLGHQGSETPRPAPIAYPDFLTGLAGFTAAADLITADPITADPITRRDAPSGPVRAAEVTLAGSVAPLVGIAPLARTAARPDQEESTR